MRLGKGEQVPEQPTSGERRLDVPDLVGATVQVPAGSRSAPPSATLAPARTALTGDAFRLGVDVPQDEIELGQVLGTGGTGVVHAAYQHELRRKVAVKKLAAEHRAPEDVAALLREAWIAGNLEHPNILPIHRLETANEGDPQLVMKRIDGAVWHDVLHSRATAASYVKGDKLEWHLKVLIQVCHAIHFAHSKGVLHRDLKPDNVMLGGFGEVYVVDWGLAVSVRADSPTWMPRVTDIEMIAGTPAYMAPEMAGIHAEAIDARTDVFLLGALLHEVITGERRYPDDNMQRVLEAAYACVPPSYDVDVPSELAAIATRAMARSPADRYQSAAELREALEDFLRHRSSLRQSAAAERAFRSLVADCESSGTTEAEVHIRSLSARLGFRQALVSWPNNQQALAGIDALLGWSLQRALAAADLPRARELLAEMPAAPAELSAQVAELETAEADSRDEVVALKRDADPNAFAQDRSRLSLLTGVLWLIWNVTCGSLHREGIIVFGLAELIWALAAAGGICLIVFYLVRDTLLTTALNRRVLGIFTAGLATVLVTWIGCDALGMEALEAVALGGPLYVYSVLAIAVAVDRRAVIGIPFVTALALLAAYWPAAAFEISGAMGLCMGLVFGFIWRTPQHPANAPS